jgi:hypothetical protein
VGEHGVTSQPQPPASEDRQSTDDQHDTLRGKLAELGSETPAERTAKVVVPWLFTIALHAAILLLGFVITWSVVMLGDDRDAPMIVADFDAIAYDPVALLDAAPVIDVETTIAPSPLDIAADPIDDPFDMPLEPLDRMPDVFGGPSPSDFAPPPVQGSASFLGVSTSNAQRVVYVIDASGTMIPYLPIVLKELASSLEQLTDQQSFSIVFFQRNEAIPMPPQRRLVRATTSEKRRALQWCDEIVASGRSNPLPAFEAALRMNPDVIFVLSQNITGSGIYEVDQEEVLQRLDRLNPMDRLTGQRSVQINCIQFLDPDPLDTLRKIAEHHGGPRGYKFLSRAELGLSVRDQP